MMGVKEKDVKVLAVLLVVLAVSAGLAYGFRISDPVTGGGDGGEIEGYTSLSVTFFYTDDTFETVQPDEGPLESLGIVSLTVTSPSNHKEITRIEYDVKVKATWSGDLVSAEFGGSDVDVSVRNAKELKGPTVKSSADLSQGEYAVVASGKIYGGDIDAIAHEYFEREGEVFIDIDAVITLTVKFKDGSQDSKTGSASGAVKVLWEPDSESGGSSLTSISVQIDRQRLT